MHGQIAHLTETIVPSHERREELRRFYDSHSEQRESSTLQDWKSGERSRVLSALREAGKIKLLELGAGTGRDGRYFQENGLDVVCIDLSPANVELCRQKGLTACVMDMVEMDFPERSFDAVYAMNSLLHLTKEEFRGILRRIEALLRADGMVYIGVYGGFEHEGVWDQDSATPKRFFSFFSDQDLEDQVSKVFDIVSFNRVLFEPDAPVHFQSLLLKKKPLHAPPIDDSAGQ